MSTRVPLSELVQLPGPFLFRVVADHHDDLAAWCADAMRGAIGRAPELVETQPSSGGRYRSVRLTVTVHTAEEIEAVYAALKGIVGVRLLL